LSPCSNRWAEISQRLGRIFKLTEQTPARTELSMKIVFSRKGFDSSAGGVASPIFSTGEYYSIPIPEPLGARQYQEISAGEHKLGVVASDLSNGRTRQTDCAHVDPDLRYQSLTRKPGWRPLFGQASSSESHLRKNGVGAGDIFLFFGWFREVTQSGGRYAYVKGAPDNHVIFGWLQIEQRIEFDKFSTLPEWTEGHPHLDQKYPLNTLYISTHNLELPGIETAAAGAGTFTRYHESLCLTASGNLRSRWRLPKWFYPGEKSPLSYHRNLKRWSVQEDCVLLQSAGRGQEFVLDCDEYPEAISWLGEMFGAASGS